jgi:phenylacetate-CoA ligase
MEKVVSRSIAGLNTSMNPLFSRMLYFGLQFLRREPIRSALVDVQRSEFLPLDKLRELQTKRMISKLQFAIENVPHYRNNYQSFASSIFRLKTWDDVEDLMNELPPVSKDQAICGASQLMAQNWANLLTYPDKTSGSTGTPLEFPCDQRSWAYRHALTFRAMKMHGVEIGDPHVLFYGLHWNKRSQLQIALRDVVFNRVRVSAFDINRSTFESYLKAILKHFPVYFLGYPSTLYDFCFLAQDFGIDLRCLRLKAVFTTAEPLLAYQRELIQETTGSRCVNLYGSAEGGLTAFECPAGNLHRSMETTWLRFKNPADTEGEVFLTDMMLRAYPLINYAIGDELSLKEGKCDCGRAHPLIESINGRSGEPIRLPNGKVINSHLPVYIFKSLAALKIIRRFRFVLQGRELKLFLIVSEKFNRKHLALVEQETRTAFGEDIQFKTHIVSEMETLPNAKHKSFVVLTD